MTSRKPLQRGVVFDLDGVLVMSEHLWEDAWTAYATHDGYAWSPEDTRRCQGMSVSEWARYVADRTSGDPDDVERRVIASVADAYRSGQVSIVAGAIDLVADISAHVPVALASSAPREIIDIALETMGIAKRFAATCSSSEVGRGKPSPDVYLAAVQRLGVDAAMSVAIEDSSNGVRAASAAGLRVIAVPQSRYPLAPDAAAKAASVHASLDGVRAALIQFLNLHTSDAGS